MAEPTGITFALGAAARAIPSVLVRTTGALLEQGPVTRAIGLLEARFPLFRRDLRATLPAWLSDERVLGVVRETQTGGAEAVAADPMIDAFLAHTPIPDLDREVAERLVSQFLRLLAQEAAKEETGPWRQENISRYEGRRTRSEMSEGLGGLREQMAELATRFPPIIEGDDTDSDAHWHGRIDEVNRTLRAGKISTALGAYRQILDETESGGADPRVRYRLHANIGACQLGLGRWREARESFRRAREVAPNEALPLAQLAQIELGADNTDGARELAAQARSIDPEHIIAWLVTLETDPSLSVDPPDSVTRSPHYWLARARGALLDGTPEEADRRAREALTRSDRSAHELVQIAEVLHGAGNLKTMTGLRPELRDQISQLATEALAKIDEDEWPNVAAHALTLRGFSRAPEGTADARRDLTRALQLAPTAVSPRIGLAQALINSDAFDDAIFVLREIPTDRRNVQTQALLARAMAYAGKDAAGIEREVLAARELIGHGPHRQALLLDITDVASRTDLDGLVEQLLDELDEDVAPAAVRVMRARAAAARDESALAEQLYREALEAGDDDEADRIRIELGAFLFERGQNAAAAEEWHEAGAVRGPEQLRARYGLALLRGGRWTELAQLLEVVSEEGSLPAWALDAAAHVALTRDDLAAARSYLVALISRGESTPRTRIHLAYALLRMGELPEARATLEACEWDELGPDDLANVAKLHHQAGQHDLAVRAAYRASRKRPGDLELDVLLAGLLFRTPDGLEITRDPDEVAPDTWVRLEAMDGSNGVAYYLTSDDPLPGRAEEIAFSSPQAGVLRGKRIGDTVVLRPRDIAPVEYRVREIRTIYVRTVQDALGRMKTRIGGDRLSFQAVNLGPPDSIRFMAPLISAAYQGEESRRNVLEFYHTGRIPAAAVAHMTGVPLRQLYRLLTEGGEGPLRAEFGTTASSNAALLAARGACDVVVAPTALFTLHRIGLLDVVSEVFETVSVPPALADSLRVARQQLQEEVNRGAVRRFGPGPRGLEYHEISADLMRPELDALDDMIAWASNARQVARPVDELGEEEAELREGLGDVGTDAILAASETGILYADDMALRWLAESAHGVSTFSTHAVLEVAEERSIITQARRMEAVLELIRLEHWYVPVSSDLLSFALRADGFLVGPRLRSVLDRMSSETTMVQSSIYVAAAFIRFVAKARLAGGAFRGVVWAILDSFYGLGGVQAVRRLDNVVEGALALLPLALDRYKTERTFFLKVKGHGIGR